MLILSYRINTIMELKHLLKESAVSDLYHIFSFLDTFRTEEFMLCVFTVI